MITIDVANNGEQIAYIMIEKLNPNHSPVVMQHDCMVSLLDKKHPSNAQVVKISYEGAESYLTLLRKAFTKLEESQQ